MVSLLGIKFTGQPFEKVVQRIISGRAGLVVTADVGNLATLKHGKPFRLAYKSACARAIGGFPLLPLAYIAAQKDTVRFPGSDLAASALNCLRPDAHRPFFVVSDQETADAAKGSLLSCGFSHDQVAVQVTPFGFEQSYTLTSKLRELTQPFRPTQAFFAIGVPKLEIWCCLNRDSLGEAAILCVGSGLNMAVGAVQRGSRWMGAVGLEWTWRFAQDPARLGPRY